MPVIIIHLQQYVLYNKQQTVLYMNATCCCIFTAVFVGNIQLLFKVWCDNVMYWCVIMYQYCFISLMWQCYILVCDYVPVLFYITDVTMLCTGVWLCTSIALYHWCDNVMYLCVVMYQYLVISLMWQCYVLVCDYVPVFGYITDVTMLCTGVWLCTSIALYHWCDNVIYWCVVMYQYCFISLTWQCYILVCDYVTVLFYVTDVTMLCTGVWLCTSIVLYHWCDNVMYWCVIMYQYCFISLMWQCYVLVCGHVPVTDNPSNVA